VYMISFARRDASGIGVGTKTDDRDTEVGSYSTQKKNQRLSTQRSALLIPCR
jgi:hypothetical protein